MPVPYGLGGGWSGTGTAGGSYSQANTGYMANPDMFAQEGLSRSPDSMFSRGIAAQTLPYQLQQQRFNTILPYLTNAMGNFSRTVGGQSGPSPGISVGPVWSPQQIQQQVNASQAHNDQATAGNFQQAKAQMGARGFGSQSPLLAALQAQYQNQNLATNTQNRQQIGWNAAQGNAQQVLQSQQAREAQFASRQQEDIERRKVTTGYQSALLSALAGLA